MTENRAVGAFAVSVKVLCDDSGNGHGDADEAVMVNTDPNDVEPSETTPGRAPGPAFTAAALFEQGDREDPLFDAAQIAEVIFLVVELRADVGAQKREKGRNGKGFITVADHLKVYGVPIEADREK